MATGGAAGLLGDLFGNDSTLYQLVLWSGFGQVIGAAMGPYLQDVANTVNADHPELPISPADLADMVVRNIMQQADAAKEASMSGVNSDRFDKLVKANGQPPGLESVLEWARRGYVPWADAGPGKPSVPEAVRTSRIRNEWLPVIEQASLLPLTVADAINAWVRGQVSADYALKEAYANGIDADRAQILYNTTGRPPSPMELAEFVRRGLIGLHGTGPGVLSFQQGIIEGDLKDKWEPVFEALVDHIPGIYDVRRMQAAGAITEQAAFGLYKQNGLADELAHALVATGSGAKLAGAKKLAESQVLKMYEERFVTEQQATDDLVALGYSTDDAGVLLAIADKTRAYAALNAAITNVRSHYLARKLPRDAAVAELTALGVTTEQQAELMQIWDIEWAGQHRVLTPAQIVDAVYYNIADQGWALGELTALGYDEGDAWVLISLRLHGPQGTPPTGAPPTPPQPAAGGTATTTTGG